MSERTSGFGLGFLIGAIIGAVVALLFAPKSGKESRNYIKERLAGLKHVGNGKTSSDEEFQLIESENP